MKTKARKHRRKRSLLVETVASLSPGRVNRAAGVIKGVKVLGLTSVNRRRYLPEAIRKAMHLYEGASVRANHPKKPADQRGVEEVFGWLENVEMRSGGLYADLHVLNPKTELAESVFQAAEKNPRLFGLSHNCQGDTETDKDGIEIVHEIHEVRSVDLVADPATTAGLFEGRNMTDGYEDDAAVAAEPAPDHKEALRGGFEASCNAIIGQALSGEMDPTEALKQLRDLLKSHAKLSGGGATDEEEGEDEDMEEECASDEDEDRSRKEESRKHSREKKREKAYDLCEEAGLPVERLLMEALMGLPDNQMRRFVEREKGRVAAAAAARPAPRSGVSTKGKRVVQQPADDVGDFISTLRG